jgi:hypothetical protein
VVGELEGGEAEQFFAGRYVVDDYSESEWDEEDEDDSEYGCMADYDEDEEEEDTDPDDKVDHDRADQPEQHHRPASRWLFHFWPF